MAVFDGQVPSAVEHRSAAVRQLELASQKSWSVAEIYSAFRNADPRQVQTALPFYGLSRIPGRMPFGFN